MIEGQLDMFECIEIAEQGLDGHPPTKRDNMNVTQEIAQKAGKSAADDAVEAVELALGIELSDDQWEQVSAAIEADFIEAIQENFAELG